MLTVKRRLCCNTIHSTAQQQHSTSQHVFHSLVVLSREGVAQAVVVVHHGGHTVKPEHRTSGQNNFNMRHEALFQTATSHHCLMMLWCRMSLLERIKAIQGGLVRPFAKPASAQGHAQVTAETWI